MVKQRRRRKAPAQSTEAWRANATTRLRMLTEPRALAWRVTLSFARSPLPNPARENVSLIIFESNPRLVCSLTAHDSKHDVRIDVDTPLMTRPRKRI
jgi:hypothetical protein